MSGPFITYAPPGAYTQTLFEQTSSAFTAGLRLPVLMGVGQEELEQLNLDLIRGSNASVDQEITKEDVSLSWVVDATNPQNLKLGAQTGLLPTFKVKNGPIVDGEGSGKVTNDTSRVTVTVNGSPVALASVQGAKSLVTLQVPPQPEDVVRVTYSFHRGDTSFTDDLSSQVTTTNAVLTTPGFAPFVIVAGSNDKLALSVNGTAVSLTIPAASYTAAGLKSVIDAAAVTNLSTTVSTDEAGKDHLTFTTTKNLSVLDAAINGVFGFLPGTSSVRNSSFQVYNRPVVDGTGGGTTTTDPSRVVVKVNGEQVIPTALDGKNGVVTLGFAPAPGSTVSVQYYANTWQDTFDYLPNSLVTNVLSCGITAGRNDYIQGADFVISNPSQDVSIIHWGTSFVVASGKTTLAAEPFDSTQITGTLVDDKMYMAPCSAVTDTSTIPATVSTTDFLLPEVPTMGNGRDTPLGSSLFASATNLRQDRLSNRPDLVTVRVGRNLADALNRPAVTVTKVDGATRRITLRDPLPPDYKAFATFWYNRIQDDTYLFTCTAPGALGAGKYTVLSSLTGKNLYQVKFGTKSGLSQTVQWPRGVETIPDAFHTGAGTPVSETVTVTFGTGGATNAKFTNRLPEAYSFYSGASATWITKVNGTNRTTTLSGAVPGYLVSAHVTPIQTVGPDLGKIVVSAGANTLNLVIDGNAVAVTLTTGNRTTTQILTDINDAIDAAAAFSGTAPNNLASSVQIGSGGGDHIFFIKSYTAPGSLPTGFDALSSVQIAQGTAEGTLGFKTLQRVEGTSGAVNKPAMLLSTLAGTYNIVAGVNDTMTIEVDGTQYTVTLPAGSAVATSAVVSAINTAVGGTVASAGANANLNKLRLMSTTTGVGSTVATLSGNALTTLGFTVGQRAYQTKVSVQEVVNALMATSSFTTGAVAYPTTLNGSQYLTIESITTGASGSSIGFVTSTAFNTGTGIGITTADGDVGEDAYTNFVVTSSNASGSSGSGIPGQTYTDARTGLRFSVLASATGTYTATGYFTLVVSPTFDVSPSIPTYALGGLELLVSNTTNVFLNDTATVQTFNPGGVEPSVGDYYTLSYRFLKQDFSTRLFQQTKTIEANFGRIAAENRVSLASYLAITNGAVLVGIKQVKKATNSAQAADQTFVSAIQELATPLPGGLKPDVMVPLTSSSAVFAYLSSHCAVMSDIRNQSERMAFVGFSAGTSPTNAQAVAKALSSNRIVALYPDSAVVTLQDALGQSFDSLVDGSFVAAAVAGSAVSPQYDVATPYTRRRILGITKIPRILDVVTANQVASAGITILEDLQPLIRIRHGLTTKTDTILTRLPTVTQISDYVQQQTRSTLDPFIGVKYLNSRLNDVILSVTALLKNLKQLEIISAFTGVDATVGDDPTVMNFVAYYSPVFPLLYIVCTYNLRSKL